MTSDDINLCAVVAKLAGPIEPVGCSRTDEDRLANLSKLTSMVEEMLDDISYVASRYENSPEHSVSKIGQKARKFLTHITECY